MELDKTLSEVTDRICNRSRASRASYLKRIEVVATQHPRRSKLGCTNLAHAFAASAPDDKKALRAFNFANIAIVSAYNDMLSAHQPFARYPDLIKTAARKAGAVAQFAGGVPAMCDGITQGEPGMELSLFSRDVIAMSTAVALSHNTFDAALYLGVCDKIVPGLLIGALQFGHLPAIFVPAGPMTTGMSNAEKSRVRQLFARGELSREELLEAESKSYHGPGTCTFYGTANSNQMLMEVMGLHLPGAAFINPNTPLRDALTVAATERAVRITALHEEYTPIAQVIDERAIVNGIVGLLATGGSTNHTIHLVAIARAAGILINWDDFNDLSAVIPLLAKVYPNGSADVNQFHAAGGVGFLIRELLSRGLLHENVMTVAGRGLSRYTEAPQLDNEKLSWQPTPINSLDESVLAPASKPFQADGGLRLLRGNLGRAVIKSSAVAAKHRRVHAPALVFNSQEEVIAAYEARQLQRDFIAVVRFQGPRANGMPELHKLTPLLGVLQDDGFHVALVTDGRMSGASGKVPAAIHVSPECLAGGPLGKVQNGDMVLLDAEHGILEVEVAGDVLASRSADVVDLSANEFGMGRELFSMFRSQVSSAEQGAITFGHTAETNTPAPQRPSEHFTVLSAEAEA
ncbi:phosphogluconate dehydratase [Stenotrophobium rhamnosiphilum]|uniref:Phosphogluconate dehydratase n=1 Tax=Stenotrophobium rhamnosiphilum TaxID=2029166 RepID=A0A2T5MD59_9GAMM|nr:phosphogluconate dehydratase [Stenotrophobium rhamnosiphilum]PTU30512.1 phosphogluconate dehydratase [Stenotrophobium rhamnosiphilum]